MPFLIIAQAMRAVLFASAAAATFGWLRAAKLTTQRLSRSSFPLAVRITERANVVTGLLELRIQRATLFYQYRNLTGGAYEQIRGITMPPAVQTYGVRWEFWN